MKLTDELQEKINEFYEGKFGIYSKVLTEIKEEKGSISQYLQNEIVKIMERNIFEPWHPIKQDFRNSYGSFQIISVTPNDFEVIIKPNPVAHYLQLSIKIKPNNIL